MENRTSSPVFGAAHGSPKWDGSAHLLLLGDRLVPLRTSARCNEGSVRLRCKAGLMVIS